MLGALQVGLASCTPHVYPGVIFPGGRVFGPSPTVTCLGSVDESWFNFNFPARGGCITAPPIRVTYRILADPAFEASGQTISLPEDSALHPDHDTPIQFVVPRANAGRDGGSQDIAQYTVNVTIEGDCRAGGVTRASGSCVLKP